MYIVQATFLRGVINQLSIFGFTQGTRCSQANNMFGDPHLEVRSFTLAAIRRMAWYTQTLSFCSQRLLLHSNILI